MITEFKRLYNCEQENRGWVVNKIDAFQNKNIVGHIKIAYIPKDNYNKYYASPVDYMCRIGGWGSYRYNDQSVKEYYNDRKILKSITWHAWTDNDINNKIDHMSDNELLIIFNNLESFVTKKYSKRIKEFKLRFVDRPMIDYILVDPYYRRQGIGTQLYLEATKMMKEKGLPLRASSLQSSEAKAVWKKFKRLGLAATRGKWLYLNV